MPVTAISTAVGLYGAHQQNKAAKDARNAQNQGLQQGQAAFEQARQDLMPFANFGREAIPLLQQLNAGDFSGFENAPDYQFALQQMTQGLDRSAAARGSLFSGGHEVDLAERLGGLASQNLGAYRGSLLQQLGLGQSAAAGQAGMAGQVAGLYGQQGANNAAYALQRGDNNAQLGAGLGGLFAGYLGQRSASSYGAPASPSYTGLGGQGFLGQITASGESPFTPEYAANYGRSIFGGLT